MACRPPSCPDTPLGVLATHDASSHDAYPRDGLTAIRQQYQKIGRATKDGKGHQDLSEAEKAFVTHLREICPLIGSVYDLAQRFLSMARQRQKELLPSWIQEAKACGVSAVAGFAQGLVQDLAAVEAALSLSWSNGQTEGQVNRLKLVKRSMYGRAGFDLLKARVLALPA